MATGKVSDRGLCLSGCAPAEPAAQERQEPRAAKEAMAELPPGLAWSVACHSAPDGGARLAPALRAGASTAASDGSLKLELGASALTMQVKKN